jgi:hypothetical protein
MSRLQEGLERHALQYLVMPLVSIDEYESKIDDRRVIVTAFYVADHDPALDLSIFIEKSSVRPLDTDVSPAPTDDGYYLVFVEMTRNAEFPTRLTALCQQVSNLTATKQWQFRTYGMPEDELLTLSEKQLRKRVNLEPSKVEVKDEPVDTKHPAPVTVSEPPTGAAAKAAAPTGPAVVQEPTAGAPAQVSEPQTAAETIGRFLGKALVETVEIRGQWLRISDRGQDSVYRIQGFKAGAHAAMPVFGLQIGNSVLHESLKLQQLLGHSYEVDCADQHVTVSDGNHHLVLAIGP